MSTIHTGGDAFPSPGVVLHDGDGNEHQQGAYAGLTLRDYFAAHAPPMPDWFRNGAPQDNDPNAQTRFFWWRWHYADAMLAKRGDE